MRESDRNRFPAKQQTFRAVRSGNCTGFHSSLESREQLASILPGRVHVKCLIPRRNAAKGLGSAQEKQQQQRGKGILERSNDTFYRLTLRRAEDSPIFFPFLIPADFCVSRAALSRFSIKRDGGSALVESYRSHTGVGSKRKKEGEGRERWKMAIKSSILYAKRARVCVCVWERAMNFRGEYVATLVRVVYGYLKLKSRSWVEFLSGSNDSGDISWFSEGNYWRGDENQIY